nr:penicillin acylase family protein [Calditrichia bacterium]
GKVRGTDLQHLAGFEGFGQMGLPSSGNLRAVNAIRRNHGPSWRMVVEMGDTLKAWTMMPGGQSGNPGEAHYGDQSEDWLKGRYRAVFLWEKGDTSAAGVAATALFERN